MNLTISSTSISNSKSFSTMSGHYKTIPLKTSSTPFSISSENNDISENHIKTLQNVAYATFLFLIICLSHNLITVTLLWNQGMIEMQILYLAIAYLLLGVPAAYFTWHRELNRALRGEKGFVFRRFFVVYMIHIVFCLFAWVDPYMEKSLTGIASGMLIYFEDGSIGIFYFFGALFFFVEYLMSIWVIANVHKLYLQGVFSYEDHDDVDFADGDELDLEGFEC